MNLTSEQQAIIDFATTTTDNLLVSALAGAAKTSTLVMVASALPKVQILSIAFNKRIADEMAQRLPPNCEARTLNAIGHRAWSDTIGRRLIVDTSKNFKLLSNEIDRLARIEKSAVYKDFGDTLDMIAAGKTSGYVPSGHFPEAKRLMDDDTFFDSLDVMPTELQRRLVRAVSIASIKAGFDGKVDFDDQILLPTVFSALFPSMPLVLVDEAQDLSELNHAMLRKLVRKRVIGVGDERQSIYAFRGAHEQAMSLLANQFSMQRLGLTTTFRCPKEVVRAAWWHAPLMKWADWAQEGVVRSKLDWGLDEVSDGSAILCRNNAPLFAQAIKFLKNGRNCTIVGNDIGKGLLKIMKKFGDFNLGRNEVEKQIEKWSEGQLAKSRSPARVADRADCMRLFASQGGNLGEAMAYAEHLFRSSGPVQMMTVHKSKGLEYDDVFLLDEHLIGDVEQEKNLRYVAQTRAKNSLTYVTSEGFQ